MGGFWDWSSTGYYSVRVETYSPYSEKSQRYWALEYIHSDDSIQSRQWKTEIGVEILHEGRIAISIATFHSVREGFVGEELLPPSMSVPNITKKILHTKGWSVSDGCQDLRPYPEALQVGDGVEFKSLLESSERSVPVVLIGKDAITGEYPLDPSKLAESVAGTAKVYHYEGKILEEELYYCLGLKYCCKTGVVRVYFKEVDFDSDKDFHRHRFISRDTIGEKSKEELVSMIAPGMITRNFSLPDVSIRSIDSIEVLKREDRIRKLKEDSSKEQGELFEILYELEDSLKEERANKGVVQRQYEGVLDDLREAKATCS